jgi:hypothetical protein
MSVLVRAALQAVPCLTTDRRLAVETAVAVGTEFFFLCTAVPTSPLSPVPFGVQLAVCGQGVPRPCSRLTDVTTAVFVLVCLTRAAVVTVPALTAVPVFAYDALGAAWANESLAAIAVATSCLVSSGQYTPPLSCLPEQAVPCQFSPGEAMTAVPNVAPASGALQHLPRQTTQ